MHSNRLKPCKSRTREQSPREQTTTVSQPTARTQEEVITDVVPEPEQTLEIETSPAMSHTNPATIGRVTSELPPHQQAPDRVLRTQWAAYLVLGQGDPTQLRIRARGLINYLQSQAVQSLPHCRNACRPNECAPPALQCYTR